MTSVSYPADRLPVDAFARDGADLAGQRPLRLFGRLLEDHPPEAPPADEVVSWQAHGEQRPSPGADPQTWLRVQADVEVWRACQRCLQPVRLGLRVDQWFRFVRGEDEAARLDAEGDDDVLDLPRQLDLFELIEDELLLSVPIVPRHDAGDCLPGMPSLAIDPGDVSGRVRPFASLGGLLKRRAEDP